MKIWSKDVFDDTWQITENGVPIDLTGADVKMYLKPTTGGTEIELETSHSGSTITQKWKGDVQPGQYYLFTQVSRNGETITYPQPEDSQVLVTVKNNPI